MSTQADATDDLTGTRVELDIGAVAHGGHCVARWDGRVVFVRHTLPGERVVAEITEGAAGARFLRADAVEVLEAAPGRVEPRCPVSGPGLCGGCDFQHVDLGVQRDLLGAVVSEQLSRLAGIERDVVVRPPLSDTAADGLGWRTRVTFAADPHGHLGLRKHRSHEVIPLEDCPIASPALPRVLDTPWPASRVTAVAGSTGDRFVAAYDVTGELPDVDAVGLMADGHRVRGRGWVREEVDGREFRVGGAGFWQVHPQAAATLVDAVRRAVEARPGETMADLYAGVGLFTAFLAEEVGSSGTVISVEGDPRASRDARRNLHGLPQARVVNGDVEQALRRGEVGERADVVVLDPPRTGARARVVRRIAALGPRRVVYVACDPAALARDVKTFGEEGYVLGSLEAYALFPMTHHVECVAVLDRAS
ncbi:TRAM domain-containing protein [Mumia sp. zg.B17]|uniref:class I SAM-dependent RNA methyltransferase n=1 Tax=Mumia sp. zg.B17 TaxID=2855446 RepID=UPI001C6E3E8A|nr:TRAM domain-containing protein [Mumia sp. zg.B17]MBW9205274.1 TRAM domain-containing protein [Mumia sp. zg.B17]